MKNIVYKNKGVIFRVSNYIFLYIWLFKKTIMAIVDKTTKYRLYFTTMIFAFLWVIIGDLVAMHIRVIAGVDLFGCHQPFAKTHKEQKSFNIKNCKSAGNSNFSDIPFNNESKTELKLFCNGIFIDFNTIVSFIIIEYSSQIFLRGPPLV